MRKLVLNIQTITSAFAITLLSLLIGSCSAGDDPEQELTDDKEPIFVSAAIARQATTRAYIESGKIKTGTFYLNYPAASLKNSDVNGGYSLATVSFDKEGLEGTGVVTTRTGPELSWSLINGTDRTMRLDNVSPDYSKSTDWTARDFEFNDKTNPFVAGVLDTINGTNDLLWGQGKFNKSNVNNFLAFQLTHRMSQVRVVVIVDESELIDGDEAFNISKAKVEISNVVHKPHTFGRGTGLPTIKSPLTDNEFAPICLTNTLENTLQDETIAWASVEYDEDNKTRTYTTQGFVLPPQDLRTDDMRPRLKITLNNGKSYSGVLPHVMEEGDNNTPMNLSFLTEHILTIRTVLIQDPPHLIFMPVQVMEWVDKGEYTLEAYQAGVYTAADFDELIKYYTTEYNEAKLAKFGYKKNGAWVFNIFRAVTLVKSKISGSMPLTTGKPDYSFKFNPYSPHVYLDEGGGTKRELKDDAGQQELKTIVSGSGN